MQKRKFKVTENYWMSVSDMMSALMIIFLFIAIAFMIKVQQQQDTMNPVSYTHLTLPTT